MARIKQPELESINKNKIVNAAKALFNRQGIKETKIEDVAKEACISKSTLYVYFRSKNDILNYLSLEAMTFLHNNLKLVLEENLASTHDQYIGICNAMVMFKNQYPLNYQLLVNNIDVSEESLSRDKVLREIYTLGENINGLLVDNFSKKIKSQSRQNLITILFTQWGSIYGLIALADNKEEYINKTMNMTKQEFLQNGFEYLYTTIEKV